MHRDNSEKRSSPVTVVIITNSDFFVLFCLSFSCSFLSVVGLLSFAELFFQLD